MKEQPENKQQGNQQPEENRRPEDRAHELWASMASRERAKAKKLSEPIPCEIEWVDEKTAIKELEQRNAYFERELNKARDRAQGERAIRWLLIAVIGLLLLIVADLKGCIRR